MSELSLYRKYRPQDFQNFVGQEHVRTTIINAFKTGNLSHAYLFCGPRGTGKTTTARLIAKIVNCTDLKGTEPCNKCDNCKSISSSQLIDLIEIDAASNRGIDEIRELRDKINFLPTRAKKKVYIIDEVHMLTKEAFNALLKTLEEPPEHVLFVLATTEVHKIPETIISRCQRFDFKRIPESKIIERLKYVCGQEGFEFEEDALGIVAQQAHGGMRDALSLLEQVVIDQKIRSDKVKEIIGFTGHQTINELIESLENGDTTKCLEIIDRVYAEGFDLSQFNKDVIQGLRVKMLDELKSTSSVNSMLLEWIDYFQKAIVDSKVSPIPQLSLEVAVVKCCGVEVAKTKVVEKIIEKPVESNAPQPTVADPAPIKKVEQSVPAPEPIEEKNKEVESLTPTPPTPEVEEQKPSSPLDKDLELTLDEVKKNWPNIAQRISSSMTKKLLIGTIPTQINSTELIISTNTNFQLEKLNEASNKSLIQDSFTSIFKKEINISFIKSEVPVSNGSTEAPASDTKHESELVEDVLDIFGGDLVS